VIDLEGYGVRLGLRGMPGIEVELSTEPVDVWKDVGLSWE